MAYVFSNIEQQMNGQQPNIFGQPGQGQQMGGQGAQQQGGAITKSDNSGSLAGSGSPTSGGGSGSVGVSPTTAAQPSNAGISQKNSFQGAGNIRGVQEAQKSVADTKQNLQNEANSIVGSTTKTYTAPSLEGLGKDASVASNVGGFLNRGTDKIGPVALKTNTEVPNLGALNSPQARQSLLAASHKGQNYTGGMAALDNSLLGRSNEFQNIMGSLNKGAAQNVADKAGYEGGIQSLAQQASNENLGKAKADLMGSLGSTAAGIKSAAQQRADQQNAAANADFATKMAALKTGTQAASEADVKHAQDLIAQGSTDPELAKIVASAQAAPLGLQGPSYQSNYNYGSAMAPEEVQRYNAIQNILGGHDVDTGGYAAAPDVSGYKSADFTNIESALAAAKEKAANEKAATVFNPSTNPTPTIDTSGPGVTPGGSYKGPEAGSQGDSPTDPFAGAVNGVGDTAASIFGWGAGATGPKEGINPNDPYGIKRAGRTNINFGGF